MVLDMALMPSSNPGGKVPAMSVRVKRGEWMRSGPLGLFMTIWRKLGHIYRMG